MCLKVRLDQSEIVQKCHYQVRKNLWHILHVNTYTLHNKSAVYTPSVTLPLKWKPQRKES